MRQKRTIFVLSVGLLLACMAFFAYAERMCRPAAPVVSARGGFYDAPFQLELTVQDGMTIYYTLDGSIPTTDSAVYEGGIPLTDRSADANVYNSVQNIVRDWEEYTPDTTPVEKGTVVRAIAVSPWGVGSDVTTETYFVGREFGDADYVLSLTADPDDLFGDAGIYVTGTGYDDWYLDRNTPEATSVANFENNIEIEGYLEIYSGDGSSNSQPVGIRIQGASDRDLPKKRFSLFSREEYGGSDIFCLEWFENTPTHSVMLKEYFLDAVAAELLSDRDVAVQRSRRVKVFLDGEYWYTTNLLERYDQQYFRSHYGVKDIILLKNNTLQIGSEDPRQESYGEFVAWVSKSDFTDDEQWRELNQKIDLQSYIDYMCANIYLCNIDLSEYKNYLLWRTVSDEGTDYGDGRYRWAIYDIDALSFALPYFDAPCTGAINNISDDLPFTSGINLNRNVLWKAFMVNEDYRRQFVLSFMDMVNVNFAPQRVEEVLAPYGENLSSCGNFFADRPFYITSYLAEEFGLQGSLERVTLSCDETRGYIQINTTVPKMTDGSWSGQYFTDYDITVTAVPAEGYTFTGWDGSVQSGQQTVKVPVQAGVHLKALFEPLK